MYLIRAGAIDNIEWLLRKNGHNPVSTLADVGLKSAILRAPDTLVSYVKVAELLAYCAECCNDPVFGFRLAQIQSPLALGEYASLINQQETFDEVLQFAREHINLHAKGLRMTTVQKQQRVEIR